MQNDQNNNNDNIIRPNGPDHDFNSNNADRDNHHNVDNGVPASPLKPEDDPALINPEELATFPEPAKRDSNVDIDSERDSHLVNKKPSPVRDGRNIISTDNNPGRDGFM